MKNITCYSSRYPNSTYKWHKFVTNYTEVGNTSVLSLGTVDRHDNGRYVCAAEVPGCRCRYTSPDVTVVVTCK